MDAMVPAKMFAREMREQPPEQTTNFPPANASIMPLLLSAQTS